jgi:hypothetical protein
MTSHIRTLSMLLFQDSVDMSTTLFIPSSRYTTWLCLCVSKVGRIHSLLLVIIKLYPLTHPFVPTIPVSTNYSDVSSSQFNSIICHFSNSPSCRNLGIRLLLRGESCNTPCYGNPIQVTQVAIKS